MEGILYVLRTGCQWKALPRHFGRPSTVHRWFQTWARAGVFAKFWQVGLQRYDDLAGIDWSWQSMDGATTKAPLGGKKTGRNPTDRGKLGAKRSLLTDARGVPIGLAIDGANRHDCKLVEATLQSIPVARPAPDAGPQNICLDKGYDYAFVRVLVRNENYVDHIRARGEDVPDPRPEGHKPRRWVVERSHSWMNRFRRILVRWEIKDDNYLAMLHFACGIIAHNAAETFRRPRVAR